jgi:hypothetical protein
VVVIPVTKEDVEERDEVWPGPEMNCGESAAADFDDAIAPLAKEVGVGREIEGVFDEGRHVQG